jgi:hypothetical protein
MVLSLLAALPGPRSINVANAGHDTRAASLHPAYGALDRTIAGAVEGFLAGMRVLIHEQSGRRTIYYPDDRHLRQYADSLPTLISIEVWPDAASAENALRSGLVTWENDPHPPDAPIVY